MKWTTFKPGKDTFDAAKQLEWDMREVLWVGQDLLLETVVPQKSAGARITFDGMYVAFDGDDETEQTCVILIEFRYLHPEQGHVQRRITVMSYPPE